VSICTYTIKSTSSERVHQALIFLPVSKIYEQGLNKRLPITWRWASKQADVKICGIHRIPQIPRWRISSTKATIKRVQKLQNRVRHRVCHIDPWPDLTRPTSLTQWSKDPVPTLTWIEIMSYTGRLHWPGLTTLELRHLHTDLIDCYNIVSCVLAINFSGTFESHSISRIRGAAVLTADFFLLKEPSKCGIPCWEQ